MDRDWMREQLESYIALLRAWTVESQKGFGLPWPRRLELDSEFNIVVPTIRQIVGTLAPDLAQHIASPTAAQGTFHARRAAEQAIGILDVQIASRVHLAPDAPSLVADEFHPSVWRAASAIWGTGQYRVAVQQGAVSLSTHIAAKAGSSLTERALVAQVFSKDEPKPGQVRLHMPGDKSTDNWKSRQDGLHLLAQGAFAGIRNVATHTNEEWTEQVALEHLAVLSVVARWADKTELVK